MLQVAVQGRIGVMKQMILQPRRRTLYPEVFVDEAIFKTSRTAAKEP